MIKAAQPTFLVAAEHQRGAAVRALFVQHADAALGVAKHHHILAQQAGAARRAVALGDFLAHAHGHPVAAHHFAHRGIAFDAAEEVSLLRSHGLSRS